MGKSLLIVESPTKVNTLKKIVGKDFIIKASVGHLKDLPKKKLGVDIENNFEPEYITIRGKGKILQELKTAAKKQIKFSWLPIRIVKVRPLPIISEMKLHDSPKEKFIGFYLMKLLKRQLGKPWIIPQS